MKKLNVKKILAFGLYCLLFVAFTGCAVNKRTIVAPGHEFFHNAIAVAPIPDMGTPGAGRVAANEFIRGLMSIGVTTQMLEGGGRDALRAQAVKKGFNYFIIANFTRYLPERRYLLSTTPGQTSSYYQSAPIELPGTGGYTTTLGGVGVDDDTGSQVFVSYATVGLSTQMIEANTGNIVWAGSYTYEGTDIQQAVEGVVSYLVQRLPGEK